MKKLFLVIFSVLVIPPSIAQNYLDFVPYRKGSLWGFANRQGKIVIGCQFKKVKPFEKNGLAVVETNQGHCLINVHGVKVTLPQKFTIIRSTEGVYTTLGINASGKIVWGFMQQDGSKIGGDYESVSNFSEGLARVKKGRKYGYINKTGQLIIACKYSFAFDFKEGVGIVQKTRRYGGINVLGKVVIPFHYTRLFPFRDGFAKIGGKLKISSWNEPTDSSGQFSTGATISVSDPVHPQFIDKKNTLYKVKNYRQTPKKLRPVLYPNGMVRRFDMRPQQVYYLNKQNKVIARNKYYYGELFKENLAAVTASKGGKCGYINLHGQEVVTPKYNECKRFSEGLGNVQLNDKWGYVNHTGKEVIACQFDEAADFVRGIAVVKKGKYYGVINLLGKWLVAPSFTYVDTYSALANRGLIIVKLSNGQEGYIDTKGRKYWE